MKHYLQSFIICLLLSVAAQRGFAQNKVSLEGSAPFYKDGDTVFLTRLLADQNYKERKEWTTLLKDGKFKFELDENRVELYGLSIAPWLKTPLLLAPGLTQIEFKDSAGTKPEVLSPIASAYHDLYYQNSAYMDLKSEIYVQNERYLQKSDYKIAMPDQEQSDSAGQIIQDYMAKLYPEWLRKNPPSAINPTVLYAQIKDAPEDTTEQSKAMTTEKLEPRDVADMLKYQIEALFVGVPAPNIIQKNPEGKVIKLSNLRGKYVLVDFWASWCLPCRNANPIMVSTYQKFKNRNFTILGVSMDEDKQAWQQAIVQDHLTWPQVSDVKGENSSIKDNYRVTSIPANVLIDPNGKIIKRNINTSELDEVLSELLSPKK